MTRQQAPARAVSKKEQIARSLREAIERGQLGPGDQLPSENELCEQFGVSRPTVREGIDVLVREGLVVSKPRIGHFVRETVAVELLMAEGRSTIACDSWLESIQRSGYEGTQHIRVETLDHDTAAAVKVAGRPLTSLLDVPPSGLVVARRALRSIALPGGELHPQELTVLYLVYELVKDTDLMVPRDIPVPIDDLMTAIGHPPLGFTDRLAPRMPAEQQTAALRLPPGTPVIETVRSCYYGPGRRCLAVRHTITGTDSSLVYDMTPGGDTNPA